MSLPAPTVRVAASVVDRPRRFPIAAHKTGERLDQGVLETIGSGRQDDRLRRRWIAGAPITTQLGIASLSGRKGSPKPALRRISPAAVIRRFGAPGASSCIL